MAHGKTARRPARDGTGGGFANSLNERSTRAVRALLLAIALAVTGPASDATVDGAGRTLVSVIVREAPTAGRGPERVVAALGGTVDRQLALIDGFSARVPAPAVETLRRTDGVVAVSPNAAVTLSHAVNGFDASVDIGSMSTTARLVGATSFWSAGVTGRGVDVALIDSGVVPVEGLSLADKIVHGPDLSFEAGLDGLRHLDTFGHGTHMAGIIAGRDAATVGLKPNELKSNHDDFLGIAPDARVVSVKVAGHSGATDVSQVIAAIDWVVQHRTSNGLNIRVLNLSFGTDGTQDYVLDPLAYAAEVAWHKGVVVVVAAGNGGYGTAKLNNPAYDPYLLAVGASDPKGTMGSADDIVPAFSSTGDGQRNPDLVAPGRSLVSLRAPGSYIDEAFAGGRVGSRFFRGSGTSQAAAVVSGLAALLVQRYPGITPDQVKALLVERAKRLPEADSIAQGAGMAFLDSGALSDPLPRGVQDWPRATGVGSLDAARGTARVNVDGTPLEGEITVFGSAWDGSSWAPQAWAGSTWSGGSWSGSTWSAGTWAGNTWSGNTWSGAAWSGNTWSGNTWSGNTWSGNTWSGNTWSGNTWSGNTWSGNTWSGHVWSGAAWE